MVGERVELAIESFAWDEQNISHLRDDIQVEDVESLLDGSTAVFRNKHGRAAPYVLVDRDRRNRSLFVAIAPTGEAAVWYVVTAYRSREAHELLEGPR